MIKVHKSQNKRPRARESQLLIFDCSIYTDLVSAPSADVVKCQTNTLAHRAEA